MEDNYGDWLLIDGPIAGPNNRAVWLCRCVCGKEQFVYEYNLKSGRSTHCNACASARKKQHGGNGSAFSKQFGHVSVEVRAKLRKAVWAAIDRCTNEGNPRFPDWGGRGIAVSFATPKEFFQHLLTLPGHDNFDMVLDRINNDRNYEPGNLRFITRSESQKNQRPRRKKVRP
jgi:hypothetical protein